MNKEQRNHLLRQTIVIDRNFERVKHRQTQQDMMRLINKLVLELYETQQELQELRGKFESLNN